MKVKLSFNINLRRPKSKTFILRWNPAISSYKMDRFEADMDTLADGWDLADFDWSVHDWREASEGDLFYMVKVGEGNTGVVMSGYFISDPYEGEDWSGKGRETHYIQMHVDVMLHPDRCPILTVEQLQRECPNIEWGKGSSGVLVDDATSVKLYKLWSDFLMSNEDIFKPRAVMNSDSSESFVD